MLKSSPSNEYQALIFELKRTLKERRLNYRSLGKLMGMTEAGVKRIFRKPDGKISTLATICEVLGFSFADLVSSSRLNKNSVTYLNLKQDAFLAKNFDYYVFFSELVIKKKTVAEVQKSHALTAKSVQKYLLALERLDLIEMGPENRIKIRVKEPIGFSKNSQLRAVVQSQFVKSMIDQIGKNPMKLFETREWLMTKEHAAGLVDEIRDLTGKYDQISARDHRLLEPGGLTPVNFMTICHDSNSPYPRIKNL